MKYTEKDLYEGMELLCIDNGGWSLWETGEIYTVTKSKLSGKLIIEGDDEVGRTFRDTEAILGYLNGERETRLSTIEDQKDEEETMTKYVEVTKLINWSSDPELLEVGKVYKVVEEYKDMLYVKGVSIYVNEEHQSYYLRSDQFKFVEQNEEEKEMKKYAKITKYAGFIDTDKENGLEIGKEYEIVKFSSVSEDCWVYLNDKRPEYFITETQYELVEKEEAPALKENVKVDTLEAIEAKIEQLANEETNLYNKRIRIKEQEESLREKRMKLKEAKKSLEFLKKQNYL